LLHYHSFQYLFETQRPGRLKSLKYHPKSLHDLFIPIVTQDNIVSMFLWIHLPLQTSTP